MDLDLSPGINGLVGKNGSGKTNILDAVHYLSMCKSYLNNIDRQNIHFDQSFFSIQGNWDVETKLVDVHCAFKLGAKKVIKYNKKPYDKITEHIGRFPVVFISPYDGDLIVDGSEMRRKWMDGILVQLDKKYLEDLQRYHKVLEQRNALLKNMFEHRLFDRESIEVWNIQMVSLGEQIFEKRKLFLEEFIPVFEKFYYEIGDDKEDIGLEYRSQLKDENFSRLLAESEKKDAFSQYSNVGIHKDDLIFTIKGHPVKKFGSQGQQKSFLIALRLSQFDWLKKHLNKKPVLMLDDIFDKLDHQRVEKLMSLVSDHVFGQVLVTDTESERIKAVFSKIDMEYQIFNIDSMNIQEVIYE